MARSTFERAVSSSQSRRARSRFRALALGFRRTPRGQHRRALGAAEAGQAHAVQRAGVASRPARDRDWPDGVVEAQAASFSRPTTPTTLPGRNSAMPSEPVEQLLLDGRAPRRLTGRSCSARWRTIRSTPGRSIFPPGRRIRATSSTKGRSRGERAPGIARRDRGRGRRNEHGARLDAGVHAPAHRLHEADDARRLRRARSRRGSTPIWRATLTPSFRACISCAARATSTKRGCRSLSPPTCATRLLRDRSDNRAASPRRRSSTWPQRRGRLCAARLWTRAVRSLSSRRSAGHADISVPPSLRNDGRPRSPRSRTGQRWRQARRRSTSRRGPLRIPRPMAR